MADPASEPKGRQARHASIVNVDDVQAVRYSNDGLYDVTRKQLGKAAGAERLGVSVCEIPPGKADWPLHAHLGNEEGVFVLSGTGSIEVAGSSHPIGHGDYVAIPRGPDHAHRVSNDGTEPLRFLCLSTMDEPDIVLYPETGKVGLFAGSAPGGDEDARTLSVFLERAAERSYYDDEA